MNQQKSSQQSSSAKFPVVLVVRWLLGLYLVGGCALGAIAIMSNWASVKYLMETDPSFSIYPMLIGWLFKFVSGVLLLVRSKWLLVAIPVWVLAFLVDFFSRNRFDQLPPEFFLSVGGQLAILSFAFWLHGPSTKARGA